MSLEAYAHQDIPFEKIVEELRPERDASHNPLFQVMFQLRNMPVEAAQLSDLTMDELDFDSGTATLDLTLEIVGKGEGLTCRLTYNTDLFDAATIARMAGHFETLLQSIVADPDQRIYQPPLLTEAERHQLLVGWNDAKRDYPKAQCIHQLFEAWAQRTPDAVAVAHEDKYSSYEELNRRANQLAHHLQKLGIGPGSLVGVCLERSVEMIVALLGDSQSRRCLRHTGSNLP